ncbi:MAG: hypothetical protein ACTSUF_02155 [Candidatus Heimdallarchaeaceae archaeon]
MAKHTNIKIKDLGKRSVESASAEETEKVNNGNWIELKNVEIRYDIDSQLNDSPEISKFENDDQTEIYGIGECDKSGITLPKWTVSGVLKIGDSSDMRTFANLVKLVKTKGVKQITGVDTSKSLINYVNYFDDYIQDQSKTANSVNSGLYVRIKNLSVRVDANSEFARYTLVLIETS